MSRRKGRPKYRTDRKLRDLVSGWIPSDEKGIRWVDLEKRARAEGVSLRTVQKYLARLQVGRSVERRVDPNARPPAVYYRKILDNHFQGVTPVTAASTPTVQEWMKEWCPDTLESFSDFTTALTQSVRKLHKIRSPEKVEDEQGRLFLWYGNMFLAVLSNLLTDYSDIGPPEEAEAFFAEALDALVAPLLSGIARIADPRFGRCKYAMEEARMAILETLPAQLRRYDEARATLRKSVESLKRRGQKAQ
jgi:hypothetical protein